ncbi:MAG: AmmeMemoRadiSam system radical SAM enzyme, partial [Methylococcales bacterium]
YGYMDAANVDLKAFSERFYRNVTGSKLGPVLETLEYIHNETDVWLEITTLLIPDENDGNSELDQMSSWILDHLGPDVPLHFSAFHPDWKMRDKSHTPMETLIRARKIALDNGIHHVYVGNVHNKEADSTDCSHCGKLLIGRDWYRLSEWNLDTHGRCGFCQTPCAGVFEDRAGNWGPKRVAVDPARFVA